MLTVPRPPLGFEPRIFGLVGALTTSDLRTPRTSSKLVDSRPVLFVNEINDTIYTNEDVYAVVGYTNNNIVFNL